LVYLGSDTPIESLKEDRHEARPDPRDRHRHRGAQIPTPREAGWIAQRDPVGGPERLKTLVA
jgi:hypothetical protein